MDRIDNNDWQTDGAITPLYPAFISKGNILERAVNVRDSIVVNGNVYQKGNMIVLSDSNRLNITINTITGENLRYGYHLMDINMNEYYYVK